MADNEPAVVVPLEPRHRSATAILRVIRACMRAAASLPLTGEEHRTLGALLLFVDDNSECFPSQATLCELTELNRRSLRRALSGLQEKRLVCRMPRWREDGSRLSDLYKVGKDAPQASAPTPWREDAPAAGANSWRKDAPAPGAKPWREDAPRIGVTQNKTTKDLNLERACGSDVDGRSAPLLHSNREPVGNRELKPQPLVYDQGAYEAEVKRRKHWGWLTRLNEFISIKKRGSDREKGWQAIAEATAAGSRAATSKPTRQLLDELDKERRAELSRRADEPSPCVLAKGEGGPDL